MAGFKTSLEDIKIDSVIKNALSEDIGHGDITTSAIIPEGHSSKAVIIAKEGFILAGIPYVERTFKLIDSSLKFRTKKRDGSMVRSGASLAEISGDTASLLKAERVALNLLQRLSGIATITRSFVEIVKGLPVKILDTRKTAPGLRIFEKYAVRVGGGYNHRFGLFDGVLIKDNHISASGGLKKAVKLARLNTHHLTKIEAEVKTIKEVKEALSAGVDILMLDNMSIEKMKRAVEIIRSTGTDNLIEASGNIGIENVRAVALTGVDFISIGAITHSVSSADISMRIKSIHAP
jgi:nicotinate-nucleotide pyrophosphorylase (carboxylating)